MTDLKTFVWSTFDCESGQRLDHGVVHAPTIEEVIDCLPHEFRGQPPEFDKTAMLVATADSSAVALVKRA